MTCFSCAKKGHSATERRAPCKFHPGVKCADKMDCFKKNRAATKKAKKVDVSQSAYLACSSSVTISSSSPPSRADKAGLIDTGCNALCLKNKSHFDSIVLSNRHSSISVADGNSVVIEGEGLICDKKAIYVPTFSDGLIPTDTFKDNFVGVITDDGIH